MCDLFGRLAWCTVQGPGLQWYTRSWAAFFNSSLLKETKCDRDCCVYDMNKIIGFVFVLNINVKCAWNFKYRVSGLKKSVVLWLYVAF